MQDARRVIERNSLGPRNIHRGTLLYGSLNDSLHPAFCICGHLLSDHCSFDGKESFIEQWCAMMGCYCRDYKRDNLKFLEAKSAQKEKV